MHDFLKSEWKTILIVLIFCSAIYSWFYTDETKRRQEKSKPYEYTCFMAGKGFQNYLLGDDLTTVDLSSFERTESDAPWVQSYRRKTDGTILNFRKNKLVSIEFYPQKLDNRDHACIQDIEQWTTAQNQAAQTIERGMRKNIPYNGAIHIVSAAPQAAHGEAKILPSNDTNTDAAKHENAQTESWLIIASE